MTTHFLWLGRAACASVFAHGPQDEPLTSDHRAITCETCRDVVRRPWPLLLGHLMGRVSALEVICEVRGLTEIAAELRDAYQTIERAEDEALAWMDGAASQEVAA